MELTDILSLVKAGYTREEIEQMENPKPAVPPVENPVPVAKPADPPAQVAEPVAVPAPKPVPQPAQQEAQPTLAELMQSIVKLTSAVQANAIAQSVLPGGITEQPKAEDMLAEIIRPTFQQRGD